MLQEEPALIVEASTSMPSIESSVEVTVFIFKEAYPQLIYLLLRLKWCKALRILFSNIFSFPIYVSIDFKILQLDSFLVYIL